MAEFDQPSMFIIGGEVSSHAAVREQVTRNLIGPLTEVSGCVIAGDVVHVKLYSGSPIRRIHKLDDGRYFETFKI